MNNMSIGQRIVQEQNSNTNLNLIAAFKQTYSSAKNVYYWQLIIGVPIPIFLSMLNPWLDSIGYLWIFILYGLIAVALELILDEWILSFKKKAALIQELFDCKVLSIPWNEIKLTEKPDPVIVDRNARRYRKKHGISKIQDWYSISVGRVSTNIASLICQRTNSTYDFSLRRRFYYYIVGIICSVFIVLIIICNAINVPFQSFIFTLSLGAPILTWAFKQIMQNRKSLNNLRELKKLIDGELSGASQATNVEPSALRAIQDRIYDNRESNPFIPDWIYGKARDRLEHEMYVNVDDVINSLTP